MRLPRQAKSSASTNCISGFAVEEAEDHEETATGKGGEHDETTQSAVDAVRFVLNVFETFSLVNQVKHGVQLFLS